LHCNCRIIGPLLHSLNGFFPDCFTLLRNYSQELRDQAERIKAICARLGGCQSPRSKKSDLNAWL